MKAVILAAGLGSRLRPFTNEVPKAMVKYRGQEIIAHQIDTLKKVGIKNIIIVTGYKSEILEKYLSSKYDNILFFKNLNFNFTNSAYSFNCIDRNIISGSYIHLNCDILFSEELLNELISHPEKNVIACRNDLILNESMEKASIDSNNKIIKMSLKNFNEASVKAFGLAKISSEALKFNLSYYDSLVKNESEKENYFGLIRKAVQVQSYFAIISNSMSLAEFNNTEDLKNSDFIFKY